MSFADSLDRFTAVVDATTDWDAPSACEDWTARDVVDHVVTSQRASLERQGRDLAGHPDDPAEDPASRWRRHRGLLDRALADRAWATTEIDGFLGRATPEQTITGFLGFDLLAHRWDLAAASGTPVAFTDDELGLLELGLDRLGPMLYDSGASKPPLDVPADASRQTRALARLGRAG